jgi:hypothetical protein
VLSVITFMTGKRCASPTTICTLAAAVDQEHRHGVLDGERAAGRHGLGEYHSAGMFCRTAATSSRASAANSHEGLEEYTETKAIQIKLN